MPADLRVLIFGAGGFVGSYLSRELSNLLDSAVDVIPTSIHAKGARRTIDITDEEAVRAILKEVQPTHVINLAAIAAPAAAQMRPELAWRLHALAPEKLGDMILEIVPECWYLHIGSGVVYGRTAHDGKRVSEIDRLDPMDVYSVTKAAGDLAIGALSERGLRNIRLRPFNHTGPGQPTAFAISAFASQIAQIEAGLQPAILKTGNLEAVRDFLDVRDVVSAYATLIRESDNLIPGTIFNVCSGKGQRMSDLVDLLVGMSGCDIRIENDPARWRPIDLPILVGDPQRIVETVGWSPVYNIEQTLEETLKAFRKEFKPRH